MHPDVEARMSRVIRELLLRLRHRHTHPPLPLATLPLRVPRLVPLFVRDTPSPTRYDASSLLWYTRTFRQVDAYAALTIDNPARWFECAICAHVCFVPTELGAQHSDKHPPTCKTCLEHVVSCPYCRHPLHNVRHFVVVSILAPRAVRLPPPALVLSAPLFPLRYDL